VLPTFETERLRLRPRVAADLEACLAMDRDPQVTRFVPGPWADPQAHEAFVRARIARDWGTGLGYWSIVARHDPERFLGWILLLPVEGGTDTEIGWRLVRAAWGCGHATEAALPVAAHAFDTLKLARIVAEIHPGNVGSIRVAGKLGMRPAPGLAAEAGYRAFVATRDDFRARPA
jgi:RimJ/RimL family protein N-acetyltransferase